MQCHRAWPLLLLCALAPAATGVAAGDFVLSGRIDADAHERYIELPFEVPEGTGRITVEFDYSGREEKTTIDLGLVDPHGLRGWSGGNKRMFTVAVDDATPSYRPGPLPAGRWQLLLGVPNIRAGAVSDYTARIALTPAATPERLPAVLQPVLRDGPGWYRGDLHAHTGHSDASCPSQQGAKVPCPLFLTLQAAAERGLDFVSVTEHNTASHLQELRGLQPYFDRLLLVPGMEVTTFEGHANVFGLQAGLDFRVGDAVRDWNALLVEVERRGLPISVNHPALPGDERCMGCGWRPEGGTDWSRVAAVEAVNGQDAGTPVSGIPFWHARLDEGHRLTGIGGSDNHDATLRDSRFGRSRVGAPTTVVHAASLSQQAILEGIRVGRVFIDADGSGAALDLVARHGDTTVAMGGNLALPRDAEAGFELRVSGAPGARVEVIVDGAVAPLLTDANVVGPDQRLAWRWRSDGGRHWLRVDVRAADGRLLLVGNPIYVNFPER
ncbi:CehA/McbA family metallohydrolase [uncultured Luteimonas sp.]|uniref:CehA/McbA family metallohydrolase n=1 Tax=uncultured Luteimonas sp. TaxID=453144 RepID=UPI00262CB1AE|nr:CehA/McbA family metallohydrolase [uncultured Luteimonas sp.]